MNPFSINNKLVSTTQPPYIIAEISGNHLQSLDRCLELVTRAASAGASAVKVQTINPDLITLDTDDPRFIVDSGPWKGQRLADIYRKNQLPLEWHEKIFNHAKVCKIDSFSSPFDVNGVSFLEKLNVPAYKVASNEIHDWRILAEIAKTKKPIIISTGTATKKHIKNTCRFLNKRNSGPYAFLYCISAYPPMYEDIHLETIRDMRNEFSCEVGISDHALENDAAVAAISLGATIIEKHLTLARSDGGLDSHFSLEPPELHSLVVSATNVWKANTGGAQYPGDRDLAKDGIYTRKLWAKSDILPGDLLTWDNVMSIRSPANIDGMASYEIEDVIGKKATVKIPKNQPIPRPNEE